MLRLVPSENWYKSTGQPFKSRSEELIYYLLDMNVTSYEDILEWRFKLGIPSKFSTPPIIAEWYLDFCQQLDATHPRVLEALAGAEEILHVLTLTLSPTEEPNDQTDTEGVCR
jgi:hypothetical protein